LPAARRKEIVRSAYAVLTDKGYERTSMSDIARHANVGQGTLYRYFPSKRELLDHVFDYAVTKTARALRFGSLATLDMTDSKQALSIIEIVGARLFALVDEDPAILRLITVESSAIDPELRHRVVGLVGAADVAINQLFEQGNPDAGPDKRRNWEVLGRLISGLAGPGVFMSLRGEGSPAKREAFLSTAGSIADRGLLAPADDAGSGDA
jgi:AcrR family transcriptional regulator